MLSKCCCCISLRTGSIILSIIGILGGIGTLIYYYGYWVYIVDAGVYLVAYGALLFGALKRNPTSVLVNLVLTGIGVVVGMILGIFALLVTPSFIPETSDNCARMEDQLDKMSLTCDQYKMIKIGSTVSIFLIASALNVYFWICNFSFYQELNAIYGIRSGTNSALATLNSV